MPIGNQHFAYSVDTAFFHDMESADIRSGLVSVELDVKNDGDIYTLDFAFKGNVVIACDRCLDDLDHAVDTDYHIVVKYGDEFNDDSDDVLTIPESDNFLNVAYMIYDTIALTIPLKHVHPSGQCNKEMAAKLRSHAALIEGEEADDEDDFYSASDEEATTETNDPRWDALRSLLDNK